MPIPWAAIPGLAARGAAAAVAANEVRQRFCQFYARYPEAVNRGIGLLPGTGYLNPTLSLMCPDVPPPTFAPEQPYSGGQCCVPYQLDWESSRVNDLGERIWGSVSRTVEGKLGTISDRQVERDPGRWFGAIVLSVGEGCGGIGTETVLVESVDDPDRATIRNLTVTRLDGLADDCGNPRPILPFDIPLPDEWSFPVNIPVGDFNIPITFDFSFNAPDLTVNFSPEISFHSPDITITFNLDGVDFSFPPRLPNSGDGDDDDDPTTPPPPPPPFFVDPRSPDSRPPTNVPPPSGSPPPSPVPPDGECDLRPVLNAIAALRLEVDEVEEKLDELALCACHPSAAECIRTFLGQGQGGTFALPPNTRWVEVDVVSRPENWKGFFNEGSPDVIYAGWLELGSAGLQGVRQQVQYERNIASVENGMDSFSYGLQTGYSGMAYAYVEQVAEE